MREGGSAVKLPRRNFLRLAGGAAALPFAPHVARAQTTDSAAIPVTMRQAIIVVPLVDIGNMVCHDKLKCVAHGIADGAHNPSENPSQLEGFCG